jgi:hypothetical protein
VYRRAVRGTAAAAVTVVMLMAQLTAARAGASDTVSDQLIVRFSTSTAAANAPFAVDDAGGAVARRPASIDLRRPIGGGA